MPRVYWAICSKNTATRIHPLRGQAADIWYARQVGGFVVRSARIWAMLFAAAFIARTALDWFLPPVDFSVRSTMPTFIGIGLVLAPGLWASIRSGSPLAGTCAGIAATAIGGLISVIGAAGLLAVWHDSATLPAISGSGGLGEVFEMPSKMIVPGAALGTVGSLLGATIVRWRSA